MLSIGCWSVPAAVLEQSVSKAALSVDLAVAQKVLLKSMLLPPMETMTAKAMHNCTRNEKQSAETMAF